MTSRSGFSLVEMVIVLVLAGIVSTAAISMFSTQNRLNAAMTALGESQENARSAVQVAATEIRAASGGSVLRARSDRLVVRVPVIVGIVCALGTGNATHVYFPLNGRTIDLRDDVDGYGVRTADGDWDYDRLRGSDGFRGSSSRQACRDAGTGDIGEDSDYATLRRRSLEIGGAVMLFREVEYAFGPSALDGSQRAFSRTRAGAKVELAQGFDTTSRFEYRLDGDTVWQSAVYSSLGSIDAVRVVADVNGRGTSGMASGSASFSLIREIMLRNAR